MNKNLIRFNQTEIAKLCGMDQPQVSRYLKGQMIPSLERAYKLAKVMGISLEELYDLIMCNKRNLEVRNGSQK